jgi:hypothetical protein
LKVKVFGRVAMKAAVSRGAGHADVVHIHGVFTQNPAAPSFVPLGFGKDSPVHLFFVGKWLIPELRT